jgi:hypothetical protein
MPMGSAADEMVTVGSDFADGQMTQIQTANSTSATRRFFHPGCFSFHRHPDSRLLTGSFELLLVLAVTLGGGAAGGQAKKSKAPPPPELPGRVNTLAKQLIGVPLDESDSLTSQIQTLVIGHLDEWMAGRTPSVLEPRRELESVFALLRNPLSADVNSFSQPWNGNTLIGIGYTLRWTDYNRVNVLALYESRDGKSRRVALSNFVPHTGQTYEILPPPESGDFRFLVYGFRTGKSQLRLSASLYDFDGQNLKTVWEVRDVYDGKIDVDKDQVVIRYLKEDEYIRETAQRRKPPRYEATYKETSQGMELVADRQIPF